MIKRLKLCFVWLLTACIFINSPAINSYADEELDLDVPLYEEADFDSADSPEGEVIDFKLPQKEEKIENNEYLELFVTLGILDDADISVLDAFITRAQMCDYAVRLLGIKTSHLNVGYNPFMDVDNENIYKNSIIAVYNSGIITGFSNNKFAPEDYISYAEAVKVLTGALGYGFMAEGKGGFPTGYLTAANQIGLLKGVNAKADEKIDGNTLFNLIYNSLNINISEPVNFGMDISYEVKKGVTILNARLNIKKITAQLTAASKTSLTGESDLPEGKVIIGGNLYSAGNTNADKYLGYIVDAYVTQDEDIPEIKYINTNKSCTETVVFADEILSADYAASNNSIRLICYKDKIQKDKTYNLSINSVADFIYNYKAYPDCLPSDLKIKAGSIKLIDINSDGIYDVIHIYEYQDYFVEDININTKTISSKYKNSDMPLLVELDDNSDDYWLDIYCDNQNISFYDIESRDIISVFESKNKTGKRFKTAYVSKNIINGLVAESYDSYRLINGMEYELSGTYARYIEYTKNSSGFSDFITLTSGTNGDFHLNFEDKISGFHYGKTINGKRCAYLLAIAKAKGLQDRVTFKILNQSGKIEDLKLLEKIIFNNRKINAEDIVSYSEIYENSDLKRQVILYETNSENEINSLYTEGLSEDDLLFKDNRSSNPTGRGVLFRREAYSFGGIVGINTDSIIFMVPNDPEDYNSYSVLKSASFQSNLRYNIDAYNLSAGRVAACLVYYERFNFYNHSDSYISDSISRTQAMFIVDKIAASVDNDGDLIHKIYGYQNGKPTMLTPPKNDTCFSTLKQGDVIQYQYRLNNSFEVANIVLRFNGENVEGLGTVQDAGQFVYGYVCKRDLNHILVDSSFGEGQSDNALGFDLTGSIVYIFDKTQKKVTIGSIHDIGVNSKILMRASYSAVKDLMIIKEN